MIGMVPYGENHFVVQADEPVRIEVIVTDNGDAVAHVYRGLASRANDEDKPIGAYDGMTGDNRSWMVS